MKKYFWSLVLILLMTPSVANAHEQVKESKKNRIDNYETITISQSAETVMKSYGKSRPFIKQQQSWT